MLVFSESCQNYKYGAVSNQLKDVRRVGVFVGRRVSQLTVYRSAFNPKSLVVSLNNTAKLYKEVYNYGITCTSLRISTVWWGAIVPVVGGGGWSQI